MINDPLAPLPPWSAIEAAHRHALQQQARARIADTLAKRARARTSYKDFLEVFVPDLVPNWHIDEISLILEVFVQQVEQKKSPRLIIALPPRAGKSEMTSRRLPPFFLGRNPTCEVICAAATQDLANDFGAAVRSTLADPIYKEIFPRLKVDQSTNAKDRIQTFTDANPTRAGGYKAIGVGGLLSGFGGHILIGDDLIPGMTEADSATHRRAVMSWYDSVFSARLAPGAGIILVNTRWHEDDVTGTLLARARANPKADQWMSYSFPALAVEDEQHRKKGEALHPARFSQQEVERVRATVPPRVWNAVYQQRPVADTGDFFQRSWFRYHPPAQRPPKAHWYIGFDAAVAKGEQNDYSVIAPVARAHDGSLHFSNEMLRAKLTPKELAEAIIDRAVSHNALGIVGEKGVIAHALRPYLIDAMQRRNSYFQLMEVSIGRTDKVTRARALQGFVQSGLVSFPDLPLVHEEIVPEFLSFPNGKHDDAVDACGIVAFNLHRLVQAASAPSPGKPTPREIAPGVHVIEETRPEPVSVRDRRKNRPHVPRSLRAG